MKVVTAVLAVCAAVLVSTSPGLAADPSSEEGRVVKLPETAADHAAMAKSYDEKAVEWQQEAVYHQEMAAEYKKSHGAKDAATMEKHCEKLAKDAKDMAREAKNMADYHRLRANDSK